MSDTSKEPPPPPSTSWSPLESLKEKFIALSDEQRLERLKECGQIQSALNECNRISALVMEEEKKKNDKGLMKNHCGSSSSIDSKSSNVSWRNKIWKRNENIDTPSSSSAPSLQDGAPIQDTVDMEPKIRLQDTRSGMRISRFYDWGLSNPKAQAAIAEMREKGNEWNSLRPSTSISASTTSTSLDLDSESEDLKQPLPNKKSNQSTVTRRDKNKDFDVGCARETHALWACRALALGCADDLASLKKCFVHQLGTTNPKELHYDSGGTKTGTRTVTTSGCGLEQKKIRDCVLKNWNELKERAERRQ